MQMFAHSVSVDIRNVDRKTKVLCTLVRHSVCLTIPHTQTQSLPHRHTHSLFQRHTHNLLLTHMHNKHTLSCLEQSRRLCLTKLPSPSVKGLFVWRRGSVGHSHSGEHKATVKYSTHLHKYTHLDACTQTQKQYPGYRLSTLIWFDCFGKPLCYQRLLTPESSTAISTSFYEYLLLKAW